MTAIELTVNGSTDRLEVRAHWTLLDLLRDGLSLLGTKEGCGEGSCGSCTVLVDDVLVRSCLYLAIRSDGRRVDTVEGLTATDGSLHPLQQAFVDCGAIQCGFCTPGLLMTSSKLLNENPRPTDDDIKEFLAGNFCRCGGYEQIISAVQRAATVIGDTS